MSYGIQLFNAAGSIFFDTNSITFNYLGYFEASASGSTSATIPSLAHVSETLVQLSFIDNPPGNQEANIHSVSINGTNVTAYGGNSKALVVVLGR